MTFTISERETKQTAPRITADRKSRRFLLKMRECCYAFGISEAGIPIHLHWGGMLRDLNDLPEIRKVQNFSHRPANRCLLARQEYPGWDGALYTEPALKASSPGGGRNTRLRYRDFEIRNEAEAETLLIYLEDAVSPLEVILCYRVSPDTPILDRWCEIINGGKEPVVLESALSATLQLPMQLAPYRLTSLTGRWGKEGMISRETVREGKFVLESRTGLSGPFAMPFFALDDGSATEQCGELRFGTLHWSGNWKITVERDGFNQTTVSGGINDFDFSWRLAPGERFSTPVFSLGFSREGFGGMTRALHHYFRTRIEPEPLRNECSPLVCNTYASFHSGPDMREENCLRLASAAAELGFELFVFDAGWQKALGDWVPHPEKFPRGLAPVIERVHALGMRFGLWVELESVDTASGLCRLHPDWLMRYPGQETVPELVDGTQPCRQLLNLGRDEVAEYLWKAMDRLLSENRIDYLKLDMNRAFTTPGWEDPPAQGAQSIWVKYVNNLAGIFRRIRAKYPALLLENCAAGNGRADWAFNRMFGRVNRSDNQDSLDILKLHEGFSYLHLPKYAGGGCHISDYSGMINRRRIPMQFQAFAGMLGSLAVGKRLFELERGEKEELREYLALYRKLRPVIHLGEFYRLLSHFDTSYAVYEYVSPGRDEAVIFFFGHGLQFADPLPPVRPAGLDPERTYHLTGYGDAHSYAPRSGAALMESGIQVYLNGDFSARIVHLKGETS